MFRVKLNRKKTRATEKPRGANMMNNASREIETVIVICGFPTCQGCCCSSRCSRSHSPSSGSDAAGAPPLSEVEGQGDPSSARCPETWAARPAQTPPPTPRSPFPLLPATLALEPAPQRGGGLGAPEGEAAQEECCSPGKSLSVG